MFGFGKARAMARTIKVREIDEINRRLDSAPRKQETNVFQDLDRGRYKKVTVSTAKAEFLGKQSMAVDNLKAKKAKQDKRKEFAQKAKTTLKGIGSALQKAKRDMKKLETKKAKGLYKYPRQTQGNSPGPSFGSISNSPFAIHNQNLNKKE